METIYASFGDAALAEKAAGALMDFGVRAEDISLISKDPEWHSGTATDECVNEDFAAHSATLEERPTYRQSYNPATDPAGFAPATVTDPGAPIPTGTYDPDWAAPPANANYGTDRENWRDTDWDDKDKTDFAAKTRSEEIA